MLVSSTAWKASHKKELLNYLKALFQDCDFTVSISMGNIAIKVINENLHADFRSHLLENGINTRWNSKASELDGYEGFNQSMNQAISDFATSKGIKRLWFLAVSR